MSNIAVLKKAAQLSESNPTLEKLLVRLNNASNGLEIQKILDSLD